MKMSRKLILLFTIVALSSTMMVNAEGKPQFWFFTQDPSASMYNPDPGDPNYVGTAGKWDTDSVVLDENWVGSEKTFTFWLASHQFSSSNTHVVIISNDAAPAWDVEVSINDGIYDGPITWTQSSHPTLTGNDPNKDPSTTDTYGYWETPVPDLIGTATDATCVPVKISIKVDLKSGETPEKLYLHLRAWSDERPEGGPNSHDATIILTPEDVPPETGTIIVEKVVDLGSSGQYVNNILFEFTGDVAGSIGDGGQLIVSDLQAGLYTVTENNIGWKTSIEIIDPDGGSSIDGVTANIDLDSGETVKVIYTNRPPDFVIPEMPWGTFAALSTFALALYIANRKGLIPLKLS